MVSEQRTRRDKGLLERTHESRVVEIAEVVLDRAGSPASRTFTQRSGADALGAGRKVGAFTCLSCPS
jgi:hypothetical protein